MGTVTPIRSKRKPPKRRRQALQFLVVLLETSPLVWRRILVPDTYSFWDLHVAIQDAMGWQGYHLHEFRVVSPKSNRLERLGVPDPECPDERPVTPDREVRLTGYFNWDTASSPPAVTYVYDFGDDWHHAVIFETPGAAGSLSVPRCIGGARACPPEDCGGVQGYEEFLRAIADPRHPEHAEMIEWSGGRYDPDAFDPVKVVFDNPQQRWKKAFRR